MIAHYLQEPKHIVALHDFEKEHLMLSPGEDQIIDEMVADFKKFEEETTMWRKECTTLMPACAMQNTTVTFYPELES